jgi:hypothetical protein
MSKLSTVLWSTAEEYATAHTQSTFHAYIYFTLGIYTQQRYDCSWKILSVQYHVARIGHWLESCVVMLTQQCHHLCIVAIEGKQCLERFYQ